MSRLVDKSLQCLIVGSLLAFALVFAPGRTLASEHKAEAAEHAEEAATIDEKVSATETRGVEVGEFRIRSDYPAEAQKSTVRFVLYAAIKGDKLAAMTKLIEAHREKLRDEVITATRLTPLGVFEEPDLKTFRRRILIRLNRTLPELELEDLYISDFGLIVKSL